MIRLPIKISPCPLAETTVELRFESRLISDAIFGIVYPVLMDDFPELEKLPILQLPEQIRENEPQFKFQPHYRLKRGNLHFLLGPKVISFTNAGEYIGWTSFFGEIVNTLNKIWELEFIKTINRVGLRYINVFEPGILENIDLNLLLNGSPLVTKTAILRFEFVGREFAQTLQIADPADVKSTNTTRHGSVIDIDISKITEIDRHFEEIPKIIEAAHIDEKTLFFKLLKPAFLNSLNPEYSKE